MKRVFALVLALALVLSVTACGAGGNSGGGDLLAQIQEKGTMTVALEGNWAPWAYHDGSDALVGYDADLARAIGEKLGVQVEFIEGEWDGLLSGMEAGRYDMVINGVDVTPERSEKYDFSEPYAYIRTALVVRSDNTDITSFEDLAGKTTANSIGSTYMELAEQYGATVSGVDTLDETITMVLQGRADATLNADQSFFDYLREHPDAEIKIVAETEEANAIAIPMRKGEETASLRAAVDQAIKDLKADGTLTQLSEQYFGTDISS